MACRGRGVCPGAPAAGADAARAAAGGRADALAHTLADALLTLGLQRLAPRLAAAGAVTVDDVARLPDAVLAACGVRLGPRRRLQAECGRRVLVQRQQQQQRRQPERQPERRQRRGILQEVQLAQQRAQAAAKAYARKGGSGQRTLAEALDKTAEPLVELAPSQPSQPPSAGDGGVRPCAPSPLVVRVEPAASSQIEWASPAPTQPGGRQRSLWRLAASAPDGVTVRKLPLLMR